ncbi:MAG: type II toxin-antitoxin system RelE/ParE family toxin [Capnocytophaga sp.]|nr:type II toxin-antitoxin system RelE/ParE family toxin [Capnocytophaga sp.]
MSALANTPRPFGYTKLTGEEAYRIRIGDYRVSYEIFEDTIRIYIVDVNHRKEIYKGR